MVKIIEAGAEDMGKGQNAAEAACKKEQDNRQVEGCYGIEDIVVLSDKHQNKCTGNARQYHGAYGDEARGEDNGIAVR